MPVYRILIATASAVLCIAGMAGGNAAQLEMPTPTPVTFTVNEGTSMGVSVSPDGKTLAMSLQGSIWTLPASGGEAQRITGLFDDAYRPNWSPDGSKIVFYSYRTGVYDLWEMSPDGSNLHQLTNGPHDHRDPVFSHDGTRIAFDSDSDCCHYNIFVLDVNSGAIRRVTDNPAGNEDTMPSWSPDDKEIAFVSSKARGGNAIWSANPAGGPEHKLFDAVGRADAVSWGPGGDIVVHTVDNDVSQLELNGKPITMKAENVFPFRPSWVSKTQFFYTADGKIKKRSLGANEAQDVPFSATFQV